MAKVEQTKKRLNDISLISNGIRAKRRNTKHQTFANPKSVGCNIIRHFKHMNYEIEDIDLNNKLDELSLQLPTELTFFQKTWKL
ncbi:MAG: hypothetical protein COW65_18255 [Cytophagales bacterium CG18_big_fil_WC_8_21_14_2_50_42_9]|nr:MAG: hypothetical protein COW65_18255 [Cytophagales bacterium CG18_big_fil_WC_8_21_14_2_50_42_9]